MPLTDQAGHSVTLELTLDRSDMHTLSLITATEQVDIPLGGWGDLEPTALAGRVARFLRIDNVRISYPEDRDAKSEETQRRSFHRDCSTEQCIVNHPDECPYYKRHP